MIKLNSPTPANFWAKVSKCGPVPSHEPSLGQCWEWQGNTKSNGYGNVPTYANDHLGYIWRRTEVAHRLAYMFSVGPIAAGQHIDHLCRNRICVKPEHLEQVSPAENLRRAPPKRKQTHCRHGHELVDPNLYYSQSPSGNSIRKCRACSRIRDKQRYLVNKH